MHHIRFQIAIKLVFRDGYHVQMLCVVKIVVISPDCFQFELQLQADVPRYCRKNNGLTSLTLDFFRQFFSSLFFSCGVLMLLFKASLINLEVHLLGY